MHVMDFDLLDPFDTPVAASWVFHQLSPVSFQPIYVEASPKPSSDRSSLHRGVLNEDWQRQQ